MNKKVILSLIIVLIVVVIVLIAVMLNLKTGQSENNVIRVVNTAVPGGTIVNELPTADTQEHSVVEIDEAITLVRNKNDYYTVKNCLLQLSTYIENQETSKISNIVADANAATEENSITEICKMYQKDGDKYNTYYVYGTNDSGNDVYAFVYLDNVNNTFLIEIVNLSDFNKIITGQQPKYLDENIQINSDNSFLSQIITNEYLVREYLSDYKKQAIYNTENSYYLLDEEYRNNKFGRLENYKNYVQTNTEQLKNSLLEKFQVYYYEGYTQYVVVDNCGNYYIFNETAVMEYTVLLDLYTVDVPAFIEQYEGETTENKVVLNINKFFTAINDKDYNYAYSKLDSEFKNTNFPTLESFIEYVKSTFFDESKIVYLEFADNINSYIYKLSIEGGEDSEVEKEFTVVLNKGTDYNISFEI